MERLWKERKRIWCGLPWTFTVYSFDEERFYIDTGFLNQREDEVRMYRIMDLSVTRSLLQRIFGLGTIHIKSSDKSTGDFDIVNIRNVFDVKEQLSELIEKNRDKKHVVSREYMYDHADEDDDEFDEA